MAGARLDEARRIEGRALYFAGVRNLLCAHNWVLVASDFSATSEQQYGHSFWVELTLSY